MKIKAIVRRMLAMCPAAWYIFLRSLQLSCLLLFCAVVLLMHGESVGYEHDLFLTAMSLQESAQSLLLVAVLLSAIVEDAQSGRA